MKRFIAILFILVLITLPLSNATAQADLALKGAGLRIGLVDPEDVDATFEMGAFAELGTVAPNVALESYLTFWTKSEDLLGGGEASIQDWVIGLKGKYIFSVSSPTIQPFAGGGLGFHILRASIETPTVDYGGGLIVPGISESDTEIKIGLDLGGGMLVDISPSMAILGEAWYTIVSDISQMSIRAGMLFRLGT